jgi:membrane protein DedA with SNARE-associated domain
MIARVIAAISLHGAWAGPIIGLLAFGESLAVVGLLIPATTIMIATGGLMGSGVIEPLPVIIWAIIGACLGDWLSYAIGRRVGPAVFRHRLVRPHRSVLAKARLFFRRFGFASIFFARFLGPVRACVPLVAGVMQMEKKPFQIANVASAIVWVPMLFGPGYLAARHLDLSSGDISVRHLLGYGGGIVAFTVLAPLVTGLFMRRRRKRRRISAGGG